MRRGLSLPETMKRRSESKAKCEVLWTRESKRLGGQLVLLAKLKTYLRDDKDLPKSGGPGLQVLMRSGRLSIGSRLSQMRGRLSVSDGRFREPRSRPRREKRSAAPIWTAVRRSVFAAGNDGGQSLARKLIVPTHYAIDNWWKFSEIMRERMGLRG